jgi:excisionase family DNA binding protein
MEDFMNALMTIDETADFLKLKPKTIKNWVGLRKIPYIKLGGAIRFDMKALEAWLKRKGVEEHAIWR